MFLSRNKKNNVNLCIPQFYYYIKVGLRRGGGGGVGGGVGGGQKYFKDNTHTKINKKRLNKTNK